jgi:ZIP family zinc transporter
MGAAGVALFVVIEVGHQALGSVELGALSDAPGSFMLSGLLLLAGLLFGLVGLAWIETRRGQPGADAPRPLDVAVMLAGAIGLHSFAEGLSVGQSMATSLAGPGGLVVLGVALHSLVDGAAVAAPVVGQPMPAARVFLLAAIVAGPSLLGIVVGTAWVGPGLELLVLSVAAGTLIYVLRELLRARLEDVGAVGAMWALVVGMLLGLGSELVTELGRSRLDALVPSRASIHVEQGFSPVHRRLRTGLKTCATRAHVANSSYTCAAASGRTQSINPTAAAARPMASSGGTPASRNSRRPVSPLDLLSLVPDGPAPTRDAEHGRRRRPSLQRDLPSLDGSRSSPENHQRDPST